MTHIAPLLSLALLSSFLSWTAAETGVGGHTEVRTHQRVKRWILPGTRWCGPGNNAPTYADLGYFAETDSCCRDHDHCNHTIPSHNEKHGNVFTMSHCDCDKEFNSCLMQATDTITDGLGSFYFNLWKMQCFEYAERNESDTRNETQIVLHDPMPYVIEVVNVTEVVEVEDTLPGLNITEEQLPCAFDQDLDECSSRSVPSRRNMASTTHWPRRCTTATVPTEYSRIWLKCYN